MLAYICFNIVGLLVLTTGLPKSEGQLSRIKDLPNENPKDQIDLYI